MRRGFFLLIVLVMMAATLRAQTNEVIVPAPGQVVRVAKPAPPFELDDLQGGKIKLKDFNGRPVILCFWVSKDRPSRRQMEPLVGLSERYASNGVATVGIALDTDDLDNLRKTIKDWGIPFPVAKFNFQIIQDYGGLTAIPTTFVIDRNHNIIQRYVGYVDPSVLEDDLKAILRQ